MAILFSKHPALPTVALTGFLKLLQPLQDIQIDGLVCFIDRPI